MKIKKLLPLAFIVFACEAPEINPPNNPKPTKIKLETIQPDRPPTPPKN
jgi:hypothetical protein